MKSQSEVAQTLNAERRRQKLKYVELAQATGLSVLAVRQALQGKTALRITSMMALADRLGLELMLLPKMVASSMSGDNNAAVPSGYSDGPAVAPVLTSVELALQRQRSPSNRA